MCCLTYEHDSYLAARKRFPREGKTVRTAQGPEKVIGIDIWHDQVTLLSEQKPRRVVTLEALKAELAALQESEVAAPPPDASSANGRVARLPRPGDPQADQNGA